MPKDTEVLTVLSEIAFARLALSEGLHIYSTEHDDLHTATLEQNFSMTLNTSKL